MQRFKAKTDRPKQRRKQIEAMRRKGFTLERIGAEFGLTRERVRQILDESWVVHGEGLLTAHEVAEMCGCSLSCVYHHQRLGHITPIDSTRKDKSHLLFAKSEVSRLTKFLTEATKCEKCGGDKASNGKMCKPCGVKFRSEQSHEVVLGNTTRIGAKLKIALDTVANLYPAARVFGTLRHVSDATGLSKMQVTWLHYNRIIHTVETNLKSNSGKRQRMYCIDDCRAVADAWKAAGY